MKRSQNLLEENLNLPDWVMDWVTIIDKYLMPEGESSLNLYKKQFIKESLVESPLLNRFGKPIPHSPQLKGLVFRARTMAYEDQNKKEN